MATCSLITIQHDRMPYASAIAPEEYTEMVERVKDVVKEYGFPLLQTPFEAEDIQHPYERTFQNIQVVQKSKLIPITYITRLNESPLLFAIAAARTYNKSLHRFFIQPWKMQVVEVRKAIASKFSTIADWHERQKAICDTLLQWQPEIQTIKAKDFNRIFSVKICHIDQAVFARIWGFPPSGDLLHNPTVLVDEMLRYNADFDPYSSPNFQKLYRKVLLTGEGISSVNWSGKWATDFAVTNLLEALPHLESLNVSDCPQLSMEAFDKGHLHLKDIDISETNLRPEDFSVEKFPKLERVIKISEEKVIFPIDVKAFIERYKEDDEHWKDILVDLEMSDEIVFKDPESDIPLLIKWFHQNKFNFKNVKKTKEVIYYLYRNCRDIQEDDDLLVPLTELILENFDASNNKAIWLNFELCHALKLMFSLCEEQPGYYSYFLEVLTGLPIDSEGTVVPILNAALQNKKLVIPEEIIDEDEANKRTSKRLETWNQKLIEFFTLMKSHYDANQKEDFIKICKHAEAVILLLTQVSNLLYPSVGALWEKSFLEAIAQCSQLKKKEFQASSLFSYLSGISGIFWTEHSPQKTMIKLAEAILQMPYFSENRPALLREAYGILSEWKEDNLSLPRDIEKQLEELRRWYPAPKNAKAQLRLLETLCHAKLGTLTKEHVFRLQGFLKDGDLLPLVNKTLRNLLGELSKDKGELGRYVAERVKEWKAESV